MSEKLRVAAYTRVSVDSGQMQHSLEAQTDYFKNLIACHSDWICAGIYTDAGISGTAIRKRDGFQRLIMDCKAGKIDKILVKSVSRFSRNTVDLLCIVRELKALRISIWFEEQQIDSLTEEGELMLTLMASIAQAESESISENARWAIRAGFQRGVANTRHRTFGYRWEKEQMVVVPEEAEAVKRIFANFLAGGSHRKIAEALTEDGVRTIHGNPISVCAVSNILRNITYTGNTLLQKTFVRDPISKKKVFNTGELPQYMVWGDHEAIIDMETFREVQRRLARRREAGAFPYNHTGQKYPFTMKVVCGSCGRHYTRQLWNTSAVGKKSPVWVCTGKKAEKHRKCNARNISERNLMELCALALNMEAFDEEIFEKRVEKITIYGREELVFLMKDGKKLLKNRSEIQGKSKKCTKM